MTYRQFIWGLSQGVGILGCAGAFWLLLGTLSIPLVANSPWRFAIIAVVACGVMLFVRAAVTLHRRAAGFKRSELREGPFAQRNKTIFRGMVGVVFAQWVAIGALATWASRAGRPDLLWPLIGLVLGAHFIPLARVFRVTAYYVLGAAAMGVAAAALLIQSNAAMPLLGLGIGSSMWASAAWLVCKADEMARRASSDAHP